MEVIMITLNQHIYRCGPNENYDLSEEDLKETNRFRKHIEPWLTAVFQSEHLSLLLGSGFTSGVALASGGKAASMTKCEWACDLKEKADEHAEQSAKTCGRGVANFEDQIRSAIQLEAGLTVMGDTRAVLWRAEIDKQLKCFMDSILDSERSILHAVANKKEKADDLWVSFLLSFASRTATRERLNLFTTNYDRFVEYGCDLAGLHVIDRFVGVLSPVFRATRLNIDIHYNPPGIRGEPCYLEGVIRLCKIHGSIDWRWEEKELRRYAFPFGAVADHPDIPKEPSGSVMIYRFAVIADNKEPDGLKTIDLGAGHSSSGETLCGRVITALKSQALLNESVGAGYIERNWPPALKDSGAWPLASLRQSFLNGSLTRLLDPDAVLRTKIVEFVLKRDFGLASGKKPDGGYERVWFNEPLASDEISFESGVFLLLKSKAKSLKIETEPIPGGGPEPIPEPEPEPNLQARNLNRSLDLVPA